MKALAALAEFVQDPDLADPPHHRFERLKRHVLDSIAAQLAGSRTDEGMAAARVAASVRDESIATVLARCAQARCTEIDDVHLASCTTPGAVIVPTTLSLAAAGELTSMREFSAATLAGYEAMIRLGFAMDGPTLLHQGVWPTLRAAAFGSAAAASRAYGLTVGQTTGALATALALSGGTPLPSVPAMSSRWMALAMAAVTGILAARSARENIVGLGGAPPKRLTMGLGRRWLFDDIGIKPYPTARQALSAVEAARELAGREGLDARDLSRINHILVELPERQRLIVDRPAVPQTRLASFVSVQYQIALALLEPGRLADVRRTPPVAGDRMRRLMSKIRVRHARDLDASYPRVWPARVSFTRRGRRVARLVRHPRGDARNPFGWDDVAQKVRLVAGIDRDIAQRIADEMRAVTLTSTVPRLWEVR